MRYIASVDIGKSTFDRVNRMFDLPLLSEMTDAQLTNAGAKPYQIDGVFYVQFADGSSLTYDLCSGSENYFDDVVWVDANGFHDICLDCTYELADIEFEAFGNEYVVKLNIV